MKTALIAAVAAASVVVAAAIAGMALYGLDTNDGTKVHAPLQDGGAAVAVPTVGLPIIQEDMAASNNAFAVDFYKQISSDGDENIFFSPASMYVAFSILYEGARGDTAAQMQDVFGFEPDAAARHNATAHAIASLNRDDPHATLVTANALWIADWFKPHESYLGIARGIYLAGAEVVDFRGDAEDAVDRINEWASDNTNGKIDEVITKKDVNAATAMVINNAIYFKGAWVTQFPVENTMQGKFWKDGTGSVDADFMGVTGMFGYHAVPDDDGTGGAQVLRMPYKGDRLSMMIILPYERDGIDQLQKTLSVELIQEWQQAMAETDVIVSMPKFEVKTKYELNPYLIDLGMIDAFHEKAADLLGILGVPPGGLHPGANLYVHKALHDAYVSVNEEGTEAAAVTTIELFAESGSGPPQFLAHHPFVFIIQDDESGAILFMGRVTDPNPQT